MAYTMPRQNASQMHYRHSRRPCTTITDLLHNGYIVAVLGRGDNTYNLGMSTLR